MLIKAVAGGGGKGMRRVDDAADFADALLSCRREAASSFGDDRVLIEKYILSPRHIEVQVFGDTHGNIVHLFERDCSLQRRHQKVIEEAPAPGMDEAHARGDLRCGRPRGPGRRLCRRRHDRVHRRRQSQGLSADRIWFMEMNTRLQVEHPVTEEITGVDLVEWQLRVAAGEALPRRQDELSINGWAMEARLYAEDPANGFLPSTGMLELFELGDVHRDGGRIDTGVCEGAEVTPYYDPMIAKIIAAGTDRNNARELLHELVSQTVVWPVRTNASFLAKALEHPAFIAGKVDTGLIGRDGEAMAELPSPSEESLGWAAAELMPIYDQPGFRLNAPPKSAAWFLVDGEPKEIRIDRGGIPEPVASTKLSSQGQTWEITPWRRDGNQGASDSSGALLSPCPGASSRSKSAKASV